MVPSLKNLDAAFACFNFDQVNADHGVPLLHFRLRIDPVKTEATRHKRAVLKHERDVEEWPEIVVVNEHPAVFFQEWIALKFLS